MIQNTLLLGSSRSTLLNGLVGYWKLEGNSQDAVGSNNGTDTNVSYSASYGKIGQGALLNNSRILTPITTQFTDFSAGCWFKPSAGNFAERLIDKDFFGGFWLGRSAEFGSGAPERWGGGVIQAAPPYGIYGNALNNIWHHIVTMREGTTHRLYIDGALAGSQTVSGLALNTNQLSFGSTAAGIFPLSNANMDEIGLWNRALTGAEVLEWYNAGAGKTHPF